MTTLRPLTATCLDGLAGIRHGFFTKAGGVSGGVYASLNCGPGSNDDTASVTENRRRVALALGARGAEDVLTLYQVHSAVALVVDRPIPRGQLPRADALVTRTNGLVVGALAADCTPVLFADPAAGVVAAAHAGWRGAFTGVLEATVLKMEELGAARARIRAAVGPCINQAAYEVGPEFEASFLAADPAFGRFFARRAGWRGDADHANVPHPHFDLPGFVEHKLQALHLGAVERCSPCTFVNESQFYSYRRMKRLNEPDYGRQISAIVVA